MKVYIAADHNGFNLKVALSDHLRRSGYEVLDEGDTQLQADDDFPQFAGRAITAMLADADKDARGVLICGSGQGMCMAANRFKGIRAALCWDIEEARAARNDDDSNVLCLSSRYTTAADCITIMQAWLSTPFAGASRFKRRIQQLDELGS